MSLEAAAQRKKELAAFYTHQGLTDVICSWAITSAETTVLEPSFGGCGFLRSARDRLISLGSKRAATQIFGCDIDQGAFLHLADLFEQPIDLKNFHEGDFLDQNSPDSWPKRFSSVVGNPPYLPYRKIDPLQREVVLDFLRDQGIDLDRRSSLWAYFVAISVSYVAEGGRMAWVLPSSFLYANYAKQLRQYINERFEEACAFELKERQFLMEGTEEKTIVLLAKNRVQPEIGAVASDIQLVHCSGVKDLAPAIAAWSEGTLKTEAVCGSSIFDSMTLGTRALFKKLQLSEYSSPLKDHLQVRIGLVTGDNTFFVIDEYRRERHGLRKSELTEILPRFHFATGLNFSPQDHDNLLDNKGRGYLVSASQLSTLSAELTAYLNSYDQDAKERCSTFKKRSLWSLTDDKTPPDAFLPVMHHLGPRLALNEAKINCTNTIHRVYFNRELEMHRMQLICISLLSTFSQISAEICGRSYGSGALKHEPREAEKIDVLLPDITPSKIRSTFQKIDRVLRAGNHDEARQISDNLLFEAIKPADAQVNIAILRSGLQKLRFHRHR